MMPASSDPPVNPVIDLDVDRPAPRRPARQRVVRLLAVPLAACGAAALITSLLVPWQITRLDASLTGVDGPGMRSLEIGIADMGGWAGGYLAGAVLLWGAATLLLFGPAGGRPYARPVVLSIGGAMIALLAAVLVELGEQSRVGALAAWSMLPDSEFQLDSGSGIWYAAAGVTLVTLAGYLAGHDRPAPAHTRADDTSTAA